MNRLSERMFNTKVRRRLWLGIFLWAFVLIQTCAGESVENEVLINLSAPDAAENWCFIGGDWKIQDGMLVQQDIRSGLDYNYGAYAFLKNCTFGDFELTVDFKIEEKGGYRGAGIIFRSVDSCTGYGVSYLSGISRITLSQKYALSYKNEVTIALGVWHTARVIARGNQLQGYMDGMLMVQAEDSKLSAGLIGFSTNEGYVSFKNIRIKSGQVQLKDVWKPVLQNRSDPKPLVTYAEAGGYQSFPDVVRLKNGQLICVFYAGYAHVALPDADFPKGGRVLAIRSKDDGLTWSEPFVVADTELDDRDPSICQLPDGRFLCNFFTYQPGKECAVCLTSSDDDGKTWAEPLKVVAGYACSSPVRVLKTGRLILGLYSEDSKTHNAYGAVTSSDDNGRTWCEPVKIDNSGYYLDAETDVVELPDGTLYAVMRGLIEPGSHGAFSISKDSGKNWTSAKDIGFYVPCPYLMMTSKGILLLAQRNRVAVRYSLDNAATWSEHVYVDSYSGAYPSMAELPDGRIFIVYYGETDAYPKPGYKKGEKKSLAVIYGTYFTADKDGIHFSPWPKKQIPRKGGL